MAKKDELQKQAGYSVTDLPEGAQPDPLGDASLTAHERAGATPEQQADTGSNEPAKQ